MYVFYKVSVTILYASSLVVTHGQYFGNPISCLVRGKTIPEVSRFTLYQIQL